MLASGALTFTWNNGVVNGTKIMPPIGKNKYSVEGKDVNNCSAKDSLIITVLEPIKLNSVIKDVLCFGKSTGEINNVVVGELPLNFSWNNGAKTKDLLNVTAASYSLKITDANGCEKDTSYTIKQPLASLSVSIKNTPVSCYNDKNGVLLATVTGGTKPYNYFWDTGHIDSILTELSDGTYTLKTKDQNKCEISISSTITHLYELPIVNAGKDEQFCFGETLKLNAIGASSYVWSNGQANGSDIKPEVGNFSYSVIGTDTHGCIGKDTLKASVFELPSFQEMKIQPISCYGETNGSVSISLASGKAPYTYLWSNGITDQNLTKVGAGKYKLKVLDANSCLVEISFTITQPKAPMISSLNAVDNVCDRDSSGIITSTVEGGTAPYSFSWNTTKTTSGINGLAVGEYWVKITDKNGCENFHQKKITALHARPFVDAGNSKTICYGDTVLIKGSGAKEYTWQDGFKDSSYIKFGIGSQLIRVTGKDQYGCINSDTVRYTIVPLPIIKAGNAIQACKQIPIKLLATGGLIHTWDKEVQNGIPFVAPVGENYYHVNAIDGYGCKGKDSVLVTIYAYPEVNFSSDITTGCIPLKIHFEDESAIKSNQVEWIFGTEHSNKTGNASYTFSETGCYTISLSSTLNKCTSTKTKKNHICVIDKPKANFSVSNYTLPLLEPHIELINLSQNGTNYHWNFGDGDTSSLFHTSHTYPGQANIYTIELIVNNGLKNCEDKHTEVITIQDELILYVPNTFTPNGDEYNNEFTPIFSSGFDPNYYLFQVFDRWNILLFESNNSTIGWSGSYHNQPSKSDTYTWIIHYKEKNLQKEHVIKGHVNLIR
jgi:gliding motility-associated-like protein